MRASFVIQTNDVGFTNFEDHARSLLIEKFSDPAVTTQYPDKPDAATVPLKFYWHDSVGGLQRLQEGDWEETFRDAHSQALSKSRSLNLTVYWDILRPARQEPIIFKVVSQVCRSNDNQPVLLSSSKGGDVLGAFTLMTPDNPESGFLSILFMNSASIYRLRIRWRHSKIKARH